jgi:hypothetical protein
MDLHRFREHLSADLPAVAPSAFVACPIALCPGMAGPQGLWQQMLYQMAWQQAQAARQPSLLERSLARALN